MEQRPILTIDDLYPDLSAVERAEAYQRLEQYLTLELRIYERTESNPQVSRLTPSTGTLPCTRHTSGHNSSQ